MTSHAPAKKSTLGASAKLPRLEPPRFEIVRNAERMEKACGRSLAAQRMAARTARLPQSVSVSVRIVNSEVVRVSLGSPFEIDPSWGPRLDSFAISAPIWRVWFEQWRIYAAKVRNVSKVGSQIASHSFH